MSLNPKKKTKNRKLTTHCDVVSYNIYMMKKHGQSLPEWCPLEWSLGSCPTM
jgi:hypothetical protein